MAGYAVIEIDTFWDVIEAAQAGAAATGEPFGEVLLKQLAERPRQEILEYAERFDELHDALYRWDVWAAAYLIGGGCSLANRMDDVGLRLHPDKTRIVYCKDGKRRGSYEHTSFTFLGFTFRARCARNRNGTNFTGLLPAISKDAQKKISRRSTPGGSTSPSSTSHDASTRSCGAG